MPLKSQSRSEEHTSELQSQSNLVYPLFFLMIRRPPRSTLFPTRRSSDLCVPEHGRNGFARHHDVAVGLNAAQVPELSHLVISRFSSFSSAAHHARRLL